MSSISKIDHKKILTGGLLLGLSLIVTSCSWFSKKEVEDKVPCPHVAVISDADIFVAFQPGEKWDQKTILYESQISGIKSACDFQDKKKKKAKKIKANEDKTVKGPQTLIAAISLSFATRITTRHKGRNAVLEYFVAITDKDGNVLNKNTFRTVPPKPKKPLKSKIKKDRFVRFSDKPVRLKIPLKPGQSGHDFMVFAGFQLTPKLLELNRRRHRLPEDFGVKPSPQKPAVN